MGGIEGGIGFAAGLAQGLERHYTDAQERKRQQEGQDKRMRLDALHTLLAAGTLDADGEDRVTRMIFKESGMKDSDIQQAIGAGRGMQQLLQMFGGVNAPAHPQGTPPFVPNRVTLDGGSEWTEPAPVDVGPSAAPSGGRRPRLALPPAAPVIISEVPGLAQLRESDPERYAAIMRAVPPQETQRPTPAELEQIGAEAAPAGEVGAFPRLPPEVYRRLSKRDRERYDGIIRQEEAQKDKAREQLNFIRVSNGGKLPNSPEVKRLLRAVGISELSVLGGGGGPSVNPQNWKQDAYGNNLEMGIEDGERVIRPLREVGNIPKLSKSQLAQLELDRQRHNLMVTNFIKEHGAQAAAEAKLRYIPDPVEGSMFAQQPQVAGDGNLLPPSADVEEIRTMQDRLRVPGEMRGLPNSTRPRQVYPPNFGGVDKDANWSRYGRGGASSRRGGGGRGRRGAGGSASVGVLDRFEQGRLDKAENEAAQSEAQAAAARERAERASERGEEGVAKKAEEAAARHDAAAAQARKTAESLRARGGIKTGVPEVPGAANWNTVGQGAAAKGSDPLGIRRKRQ